MLEGLIHSNLNIISKIVKQAAVARSLWLVIPQPKYTLISVSSMTLQGYQLRKQFSGCAMNPTVARNYRHKHKIPTSCLTSAFTVALILQGILKGDLSAIFSHFAFPDMQEQCERARFLIFSSQDVCFL